MKKLPLLQQSWTATVSIKRITQLRVLGLIQNMTSVDRKGFELGKRPLKGSPSKSETLFKMDPLLVIWSLPSARFLELQLTELTMNSQIRAWESGRQERQLSNLLRPRHRSTQGSQGKDWGMQSKSNQFSDQVFGRFSQMQLFLELHKLLRPWSPSEMWLSQSRLTSSSLCCRDLINPNSSYLQSQYFKRV